MMAIIKWEIKYLMDKKKHFFRPQQAETEEYRFKWNMTIRKWYSKVDKKIYKYQKTYNDDDLQNKYTLPY